MNKKIKRIPIARCPNEGCERPLLFSCDPTDKYYTPIAEHHLKRQKRKI